MPPNIISKLPKKTCNFNPQKIIFHQLTIWKDRLIDGLETFDCAGTFFSEIINISVVSLKLDNPFYLS